jgi:hypothetical protein
MATLETGSQSTIVVVDSGRGLTIIPSPTPLTRLNYFDGKFLRADDLRAEQDYVRRLVWISNQGGGSGVVHGYDVTLSGSGDSLVLGAGLAIGGGGQPLLLPEEHTINIQALIDASMRVTAQPVANGGPGSAQFGDCVLESVAPGGDVATGAALWIVTVGAAEALCGEEDVFGRLCEEACATTTDRPFRLEGIIVRAVPLALETPLATSGAVALNRGHLRSLVASAYFADDWRSGGSLISADGLSQEAWCLGAHPDLGGDVPVALLARRGTTTDFLDAWTARRERIDPPPRAYWAGRMAMRPWSAYLAQILQFQCQLHELLLGGGGDGGPGPDPCAPQAAVLGEADEALAKIHAANLLAGVTAFTPDMLGGLRDRIRSTLADAAAGVSNRVLIRGGIVELPPAGYLPVVPGSTEPVNTQVRRLLGEGVDLRFCVVRPDFVAHALEEAQHMERISLLEGIDRADRSPRVDVLVPDGELVRSATAAAGLGFDSRAAITTTVSGGTAGPIRSVVNIQGASRADSVKGGEALFAFAGFAQAESSPRLAEALEATPRLRETVAAAAERPTASLWASLHCDSDLLDVTAPTTRTLRAFGAVSTPQSDGTRNALRGTAFAQFAINVGRPMPGGGREIAGLASVLLDRRNFTGDETQDTTSRVELEVRIRTGAITGGPPGIEVRLTPTGPPTHVPPTWVIRGSWEGEPLTVKFSAQQEQSGESRSSTSAAALLREDPDVLVRGNPLNSRALDALGAIGAAVEDPRLADMAAAELFPEVPEQVDATINAARDWVLFHRRREKDCGGAAGPPPVRTTFQNVYRIRPEVASRVKRMLGVGALEQVLGSTSMAVQVARVDFRVGSSAIASDPGLLVQAWDAAGDGTPVDAFVITRTGDTDVAEVALAPDRGRKILTALGGQTVVPTVLQDDGAPAGVPAVTLIVPQIVCHRVLALRNDSDSNAVAKLKGDKDVLALLASGSAQDLGSLAFDPGTADVSSGSKLSRTLQEAYPNLPGDLLELLVFVRPDVVTAEPLADQARKLAGEAGAIFPSTPVTPEISEGANDTGWPQCPFITVMVIIG